MNRLIVTAGLAVGLALTGPAVASAAGTSAASKCVSFDSGGTTCTTVPPVTPPTPVAPTPTPATPAVKVVPATGLAFTGADVAGTFLVGTLLLAAGGAIVWVSRRRTEETHTNP